MQVSLISQIEKQEPALTVESSVNNIAVYYEELHKDYHQVDALSQLKANVNKLSDLQFKLNFMMNEISTLIRK
jgi:hypothetical protein